MARKPTLEIKNLKLARNRDFTLQVNHLALFPGKICGVVGANGSGKTSLVESIIGLAKLETGDIIINGNILKLDDMKVKSNLGFIPDDDAWLIPELSASEYFELLIHIYKQAGINEDMPTTIARLANDLQFSQFDQQLGSLSHGNKKKVQIIAALMHKPKLVVIDELRNGLDPIAIKTAETIIKTAASQGTAVLAASHDLWWAERMADTIVMLRGGEIVLRSPTRKLVKEAGSVEAKFMEVFKVYAS